MLADTGEGYPSMDVIAKARDGLLNVRASGLAAQRFGEVRIGDALEVARAIRGEPEEGLPGMPLDLVATMFVQYVVRAKVGRRVEALGQFLRLDVSTARYWRYVEGAQYFLMARISGGEIVATKKPAPNNAERLTA